MKTQKTKPAARSWFWSLSKLLFTFLICGFIGWVFETTIMSVEHRQFEARGFLFVMQPLSHYIPSLAGAPVFSKLPFIWGLPIILIYGLGGTLMCALFRRWKAHPMWVFFTGLLLLTLIELIGSYLTDQRYWNYSALPLNYEGRIDVTSSLAWGALSVVAVKWIDPFIDKLYSEEVDRPWFMALIYLLILYVFICAIAKYSWGF